MVDKLNITLLSTGLNETLACDFSLVNRGSSNWIVFSHDKMSFELCLKDVVDIEDMHGLLTGKEKKIILHSTLKYKGKEYQGLRKILSKDGKIVVSLGGVRLEFEKESKKMLTEILKVLKSKFG